MMTVARCTLESNSTRFSPFSNTPPHNVLEGFFPKNGLNLIKVLFLGCGDLKNALLTSTTEGVQNFQFHMNDMNASVMARNIMILKIITDPDFNSENQVDLNFLWDVWYNTQWSEETGTKFKMVLKELLDGKMPENAAISNKKQLKQLKEVWLMWQSISSKTSSESTQLLKKINIQRQIFILQALNEKNKISQVFSDAVDKFVLEWEEKMKIQGLKECYRKKIREEARSYFENGSCLLGNEEFVCVNPTLLHPTTQRWELVSLFPFDGYLPLGQGEELDTSVGDKILLLHCQKELKQLVLSYRQRISNVKFTFHLEDAFDFCYNGSTGKFDVIECSNLADHVGLANLINACPPKLSSSPNSVLCTRSVRWPLLTASIDKYVMDSLGCLLSMIPTIYGVQLENHIELGTFSPDALKNFEPQIATLYWKLATQFQNITLSLSPLFKVCFQGLITRSFFVQSEECTPGKKCLLQYFTTRTFDFIVDSIRQRVEIDGWMKQLEFPFGFELSRRTTEAWKNGEEMLHFSANQFETVLETEYFTTFKKMASQLNRKLRLVLAPHRHDILRGLMQQEFGKIQKNTVQSILSSRDVHFIDNFQLKVKKNMNNDIEGVDISFILPCKHGLKEPHLGFVLDLDASTPILVFESLNSLRTEKFALPYPFPSKPTSTLVQQTCPNTVPMKVVSCMESTDHYTLLLKTERIKSRALVVNVSTNQKPPCLSANGVTVSIVESPKTVKSTLKLSFAHPIVVDSIVTDLSGKPGRDRFIKLQLHKACFEPWPHEYQTDDLKLDVECLEPWEDKPGHSLEYHVNSQYLNEHPSLVHESDAILEVRKLIRAFFVFSNTGDDDDVYFHIKSKQELKIPSYFHLRFHPPIVTSPQGAPIMVFSVCDLQQLKPIAKKNVKINTDDITRIFMNQSVGEVSMLTFEADPKTAILLRFLLRLNATKMVPTSWQKDNLPLGGSGFFLASFLSPLYLDFPVERELEEELEEDGGLTLEDILNGESCCLS